MMRLINTPKDLLNSLLQSFSGHSACKGKARYIHSIMQFALHKPPQITERLISENLLKALGVPLLRNLEVHPHFLFKKWVVLREGDQTAF